MGGRVISEISSTRWWAATLTAMCLASAAACNGQVMFPPWQCAVAEAKFIGIAECVVAGGIAADYRVVESWKGPPAGTRLRIAQSTFTDYGVRRYPLALAGERYLVVANSSTANGNEAEWPDIGITGSSSTAWRRLRVDYFSRWPPTPIGYADVPSEQSVPGVLGIFARSLGAPGTASIRTLHDEAVALAAMNERSLEVETLRAAARREAGGRHSSDRSIGDLLRTSRLWRATTPDSLEAVVANLVAYGQTGQSEGRQVLDVLLTGGGRESLRRLEGLKSAHRYLDRHKFDDYVRQIVRIRVGRDSIHAAMPLYLRERPDKYTLTAWRARIASDSTGPSEHWREYSEAFAGLTKFEPERIAEYLIQLSPNSDDHYGSLRGLTLGSYFGTFCGRERMSNLSSLLRAKDPYVRVAGAVYLCFEDEATGRAALRDMTALAGDPGAWAALTLARRGVKDAVPRALEVLQDGGGSDVSSGPHRDLQKRVIELLSNSARASGLALPNERNPEYFAGSTNFEAVYAEYARWWGTNGPRIRLADPWMPVLSAMKTD